MDLEHPFNPFGDYAKTSEMVQAVLAFDWAKTELGPIETWDSGLINSLRLVFACPIRMYCTWGPQRRVFYNDPYIPILKHRHPWALGSMLHDVWPEVWDQVHAIVAKVEAGGFVLETDVQFDIDVNGKPEGNFFTYGNSALFNSQGKIAGMLCTIIDTTVSVLRNKATEESLARTVEELQIAKEAAENANQAKSAFLANMSHEIRTPLGAILGFAEIIANQDPEKEVREKYLDIILRSGKSLTRIIDDILDLSKIEAGKFAIEMLPVKLKDLLQEVMAMYFDRASEKKIQLNYQVAESADLMVVTDAVRIRQILLNLVGNAIKFTAVGSVKVLCRTEPGTGVQKKVIFEIEDTGIGMTRDQADRLFRPFTQADVTSTRRYGGMGLGLALSRNLARALGGDIQIARCEPGKGCVFEFTFQAEAAAPAVAKLPAAPGPAPEPKNPLAGVKILEVDDSPINRVLIKTILSKAGLEVTEAASGEEALNEAFKQRFDVVLLDIQMPGLDGFGTLAELRKRGYAGPIVALTAHAMKEDKERTTAAGFDGHLTKPVDSQLLLQTIQSHVQPIQNKVLTFSKS